MLVTKWKTKHLRPVPRAVITCLQNVRKLTFNRLSPSYFEIIGLDSAARVIEHCSLRRPETARLCQSDRYLKRHLHAVLSRLSPKSRSQSNFITGSNTSKILSIVFFVMIRLKSSWQSSSATILPIVSVSGSASTVPSSDTYP